MARPTSEAFASRVLVVAVIDLAGYARAFKTYTDLEIAHFLDRYYREAETCIGKASGWIVKFIGDSVLAAWESNAVEAAVTAALTLRRDVEALGREHGIPVQLGVNIHMGSMITGEFGHGISRRADIIGRTVNQAFLLGRGPGIRISEPVYRKLPSGERSPWGKNKPPVVYTLDG